MLSDLNQFQISLIMNHIIHPLEITVKMFTLADENLNIFKSTQV